MSGQDFTNIIEIKKTKKNHKCFGCLATIPVGSHATRNSGVFEGGFTSAYYCDPCTEFMDKHPDDFNDFNEGIYEGDVGDARREHERNLRTFGFMNANGDMEFAKFTDEQIRLGELRAHIDHMQIEGFTYMGEEAKAS